MAQQSHPRADPRPPWTRQRVLRAAIDLADQDGIESLSMRKLSQLLGGAPMSLYNHIANKDDLLDGMIDAVFSEIELPSGEDSWKMAMRQRAISIRTILSRHRWAIGLMNSRTSPGPATLRHHNAVIRSLRDAGFSVQLVAYGISALDSYIYGFALQEQGLPFPTPAQTSQLAQAMLEQLTTDQYPHFAELTIEDILQPGDDHGAYEFGLDLLLNGLEQSLHKQTIH